ncbi:hypothetical protein DUI87_18181 [Hirundo rustica rustica]|uniref:BPTI/Kunitz inhibitor domain-containing protein n=1 Tax=Hirundo rustica rustica TaxID=333673 RepID=A0A3M0JXW4_HIRRU|nr:hypothetical protein DUI87_18181 [Hirundo rustica rustica]
MATGRRLPLPALLLPLACAALAQRPLTEKQRACLLPPDDGPCRALVPRWYYDRHTQSCQEFTYGGCYGNANNFLTFDDCEKSCWTIKTGPLLCYSPKDEGLCSSSVPRYYYDTKTKSCKEFRYTGCGGNANNFVTEMDCYNVCRKVQMNEDSVADKCSCPDPCRAVSSISVLHSQGFQPGDTSLVSALHESTKAAAALYDFKSVVRLHFRDTAHELGNEQENWGHEGTQQMAKPQGTVSQFYSEYPVNKGGPFMILVQGRKEKSCPVVKLDISQS